MKKILPFFLIFLFVFTIFPSFADEEDIDSDSAFVDEVFDLVDSFMGSESDPSVDQSDIDSSNLSSSGGGSNILLVQGTNYSLSDIGQAVYKAIAQYHSEEITEYSSITNIDIMPLYTQDSGTTTIPSTSFRAVLQNVIGPYSPVVVQYQYTNGTNTQYLREILPDYQWMISAGIFALVLYCVFRLWGVILSPR